MTFEEILDQALDMLRQRGRVTYGALKRQFGVDDAYVADLKDAMLYADSHVVDDAGRGLRWTGEPFSAAQRAFEGVGRFYGEAGGPLAGARLPAARRPRLLSYPQTGLRL
jgi:hypothetical protein